MSENDSSPSGVDCTERALTTHAAKDSDTMADSESTSKSPAFQFYPNDFLSDRNVVVMSMQERGVYITLICHAWQSPLPADVAQLAKFCGVPLTAFRKFWPALAVCFREQDGYLVHPRLERERLKQVEYRRRQSDRGKASGVSRRKHEPDANAGSVPVQPKPNAGSITVQPNANRPVELLSSLVSSPLNSSSDFSQKREPPADRRSKHPVYRGQRLTVFDWMEEDLSRMLGKHAHAFDLHSWFYALDAEMAKSGEIIPQRDSGKWLHDRTLQEAMRRGLPLAATTTNNPKTAGNFAAAARFVARGKQ